MHFKQEQTGTNYEEPAIEGGKEYKVYAPGIGLILDGNLKLTKHGRAG